MARLLRRCSPNFLNDLNGYLCFVVLVSTIGPLLFGFHLAELNAPMSVITCHDSPANPNTLRRFPPCIRMSEIEIGLITSLFTLGGLVGALTAGPLATHHGRLKVMRYNTVAFVVGPVAEALASSVAIMSLGRFISGLSSGAAVVVVPIYISEVAPVASKGFFGSFTQVMTCSGIVLAQSLGLVFDHGQLWRLILAMGGVIGLLQSLGLLFVIESPVWLVDQGDVRQAQINKQRLGTYNPDSDFDDSILTGTEYASETSERSALLNGEEPMFRRNTFTNRQSRIRCSTVSIPQVLFHPQWARPTLSIMVIMVAQQFAGINSIIFYGVALLSDLLKTSSGLVNLLVSVFNLSITIICAPLSDRYGRKACLVISLLGMALSSVMLALAISASAAALSAIAVFTFVGSFGIGLGPVPFILASELVGAEAVGATQSWALAANWTATFVVAQFFPIINKSLGKGRIYFVFAALSVVFGAFVMLCIPETKAVENASEEDVENEIHEDGHQS